MRFGRLFADRGRRADSAALGGCTSDGAERRDGLKVFPGGVPVTAEHVLAPNDELEVRFPFYADLNDRVLVGPDGRVSMQLINTVAVGGADASRTRPRRSTTATPR